MQKFYEYAKIFAKFLKTNSMSEKLSFVPEINEKMMLKNTPDLVREIFEGKDLSQIASSLESMRDSGKFSHDKKSIERWEKFLNEVLRFVENQNISDMRKLHKNSDYWRIHNLQRQAFLFSRAPIQPDISLFSPAGSYGPYYLWKLQSLTEWWQAPDMILGGSAGALYPTLYELYTMAHSENPIKAREKFADLSSLIPENLTKKHSMSWNGKKLIESFSLKAQDLITIINESRQQKWQKLLSDIGNLKFSELSRPIGVIASRNMGGNNKFQEVLFSWDDNVMQAITASSNPWLHFGPIQYNVVKKVRFSHNFWNDGDHTNPMPTEWIYHFPQWNVKQISAIWGEYMQDVAYESDFNQFTDIHLYKNDLSKDEFADFNAKILMTNFRWQNKGFDKNTAELYMMLWNIDVKNFNQVVEKLSVYKEKLSSEDWVRLFRSVIFRMEDFKKQNISLKNIDKFLSFSTENPLEKEKVLHLLRQIDFSRVEWEKNPENQKIFVKIFHEMKKELHYEDVEEDDHFRLTSIFELMILWYKIFPNHQEFKNFLLQEHPSESIRIKLNLWEQEILNKGSEGGIDIEARIWIKKFSDIFTMPLYNTVTPSERHNIFLSFRQDERLLVASVRDFNENWEKVLQQKDFSRIFEVIENMDVFFTAQKPLSMPLHEIEKIRNFIKQFLQEIDLRTKLEWLREFEKYELLRKKVDDLYVVFELLSK